MDVVKKRAAICVIGTVKCVEETWSKISQDIRHQLHGDMVTFLFLSSSNISGPVPMAHHLKQQLQYSTKIEIFIGILQILNEYEH